MMLVVRHLPFSGQLRFDRQLHSFSDVGVRFCNSDMLWVSIFLSRLGMHE